MIGDKGYSAKRIRGYLRRALTHPALAAMRAFYERHGLVEERVL